MMAKLSALDALYQTLFAHLSGTPPCADRWYPDAVPARPGQERPYGVWIWTGGGEDNRRHRQDAIITLIVKCVATKMDEAMRGAQEISAKLNDHGAQDKHDDYPPNPEWVITTTTQQEIVYLVEAWEGAERLYHSGHQFEFVMERINDGNTE
jgi:hypothetical protein